MHRGCEKKLQSKNHPAEVTELWPRLWSAAQGGKSPSEEPGY